MITGSSLLARLVTAAFGVAALGILWMCVGVLQRGGWAWAPLLYGLAALDIGVELLCAAWRGRPPDAWLLFYLVPV